MASTKKAKKTNDSINNRLALVMKSWKCALGYKTVVRFLRSSKAKLILIANKHPPLQKSEVEYLPCLQKLEYTISTGICITTTTSVDLGQLVPWIFYHKIMGVSQFFLFVEGKAASSNVTAVLEVILGVKVTYRTQKLEEQQARRKVVLREMT